MIKKAAFDSRAILIMHNNIEYSVQESVFTLKHRIRNYKKKHVKEIEVRLAYVNKPIKLPVEEIRNVLPPAKVLKKAK